MVSTPWLRSRAQPLTDRARALVPEVRGRVLRPAVRQLRMRFPTFDPQLHDALTLSDDYFRYVTLGLALQRVLSDPVPGALAEVGVWRGVTSAFLHRLAPQRRLFLFDTFSGFPDQDLPIGTVDRRFRDTSASAVRARVGASENVVLTPGYVPDTLAVAHDESFALALLDLDLLEPTRGSLEFFYPRLSPGGYLIVHDYNNPESDWACKRALDAFLVDKPEQLIELGDVWGSALFRRIA